jgi:hypothetical protein
MNNDVSEDGTVQYPVDTLDDLITGEETPMVQIAQLELDTLKFTLDTLTTVMKDMGEKLNKVERDIQDVRDDLAIVKSPLYNPKKGRPSVG